MSVASRDPGAALLALYDDAVGEVYGYLLSRCRNRVVAEDITSEVFMGAVDSVSRGTDPDVTVAWLIGIARHKLVDHWRRLEREQRRIQAVADEPGAADADDDPWDAHLDVLAARDALERLGAHHRSALTLRYLDGLSVPEVAAVLGRTVHATEALLVRARRAFRDVYEPDEQEPGKEGAAMTNDPFEQLRVRDEPALPDPRFTARLRARLVAALELSAATDLPTIPLPERTTAMTDTATSTAATAPTPGPRRR